MSTSSFYNTTGPDSSQVTAIEGSVSSAADSAAAAEAAKVAAQSSASQAAASSNANATSAAASEASKVAAQVAENNAETAETNAAASSAAALVSQNASAASAVASEASKVTSVNNAATATTKAAEASTSETNAAASAATATTKAADSETARAASVVAKDASVVAKNESVVAKDASVVAKNAAVAAQAAAETAETNAETAETNSASSASAASASASTASTKASEASTSAAASETSKVASEAAKDAALAALDSFDDRYLGSKANAPTVDNDGDALAAGMLYFNTTTDEMKVYDGSQWLNAYASLSGALLATGNLSDLNNAATARANLGLGTAATTPSTDYATAAQGTTADAALPRTGGAMTGAITTNSTFDGRDVATDGTKLDGIETAATADQTDAEIRAAVEAATDSNVFTDADHSKLDGIEAGATADQTAAEIKTAYESNADTNAFTDADESKLDGIEASADVTDAINVEAAGGLMDSELTSIASVKALNQGVATTDSPTFAALTSTGEITANGGIALGDNDKATFGAGDDLQIYHDGSNSYIDDAGTGNLRIRGSQVILEKYTGETILQGIADGSVYIFHDNAEKLATTATGIDVTGTATMDGLTVDGNATFSGSVTTENHFAVIPPTTTNYAYMDYSNAGGSMYVGRERSSASGLLTGSTAYAGVINVIGAYPLEFGTNNSKRMTIDSSGNVGIGVSNPSDYYTNFNSLVLGNTSTHSGMTIASGTSHDGTLAFADGTSGTAEYSGYIQYSHGTDSLSVGTASTERMRIDSSGNVGIGTNSPSKPLHLKYSSGWATMRLEGASDSGGELEFYKGSTKAGAIFFDNSNNLNIRTGNTERMRIDSSGNLLVGKTATSQTTAGTVLYSNGQVYSTASGTQASVLTRLSNDGPIQIFYKDSSEVGRIGTQGGDLYLGTDDANIKFFNSASIQPVNSVGGVRDNAIDLGSSSARFKNLYLSGAVQASYIYRADASGAGLHFTTNAIYPTNETAALSDGTESLGAAAYRFKDLYLSGTAKSQAVELEDIKAKDTSGLNLQTSDGQKRVILDNSGNLLVGTTNVAASAGEGIKLRASSNAKTISTVSSRSTSADEGITMWSTGANTWRFYVGWGGKINATSNTIQAISDQRFKENIRDLDDGLSKVMELRPRKFDWKEGKGADIKDDRGFIAQEFEEVFPDLVGEWKDEAPEGEEPYKAVSQDLIPTLVKAIQEQQTLIESLTTRIAALEE